jgi:hypothetical protein
MPATKRRDCGKLRLICRGNERSDGTDIFRTHYGRLILWPCRRKIDSPITLSMPRLASQERNGSAIARCNRVNEFFSSISGVI